MWRRDAVAASAWVNKTSTYGRHRLPSGLVTSTKENHPMPTPPLTRLLNIAEVADLLGVDIRHIRRLVHERRIPYIKWGHLLRFDPTEIQTWIDSNRRNARVRTS